MTRQPWQVMKDVFRACGAGFSVRFGRRPEPATAIFVLAMLALAPSAGLAGEWKAPFVTVGRNMPINGSEALALGDLDGDGDLDAAFAVTGNGCGVVLNDGTGVFRAGGQFFGSSGQSYDVALGDVDKDGDLDVFWARTGGNEVWLNDGTGHFTNSGQKLGSAQSQAVALGDLDGDGHLDAFIANNGANTAWLGDAAGTFADTGQSLGSSNSNAVALDDLDGDGDLDAFVANDTANRVWLNDGHGSFTVTVQSLGSDTSWEVVLGDLNNDGAPDAYIADRWFHRVWLNDGKGTFTLTHSLNEQLAPGAALGDLDDDGDLDAFAAGAANHVWLNDGKGTFTVTAQNLGTDTSNGVALGDLDGDGDLDALDVNNSDSGHVWLNNGAANFRLSPYDAKGLGVALGDLDGDGDLDAFQASDGPSAVFLNDGNGRFLDNGTSVGVRTRNDVALGDLDADGDLDAFLVGDGPDQVWLNDGAGQFSGSGQDLGTSTSWSVALGDLDGDGDLDALVGSFSWGCCVWFNDGLASFSLHSQIGTTHNVGAALGDLDGDGDLDAFLASSSEGHNIWLNDGHGTFSDSGQVLFHEDFYGYSVTLGDVDGDGDLDALTAGFIAGSVIWLNDGHAVFRDSGQSLSSLISYNAALADVDGDGDLDAFFPGLDPWAQDDGNQIYLNDGRGVFTDSGQRLGNSLSFDVALGDLDGDGDLDAYVANHGLNLVSMNRMIHRNATYPLERSVQGGFPGAASVQGADVDGDADLDLVGATHGSGAVTWWENGDGLGSEWTAHPITASFGGASSVWAADLDGDGDTDIVGAADGVDAVRWWQNDDGLGTAWVEHTIDGSFNGAASVQAVDLDGDGDLDVLGAAREADSITWWENESTSTTSATSWTAHVIAATFDGACAVHAIDLDRDGDQDVVGAGSDADTIAWWENESTSTTSATSWTAHVIAATFDGACAVYAMDLDHDGDLDVLGAAETADAIAWWENLDGSGTAWAMHAVTATFDGACAVNAMDLDHDGDPDLVGAAANSITWWENLDTSPTSWLEHALSGDVGGESSVCAADIDGDGDADVLGAAQTAGRVSWWPNGGGQFALPTADTSPPELAPGATDDVFKITAVHNGRPSDSDMELATFELLFDDGNGVPLDGTRANAIVENLYVYLDDGSGSFEAGSDTLVAHAPTLSLIGGKQTVALPDDNPDVQVPFGTPRTYFVVLELTADAAAQGMAAFFVTHLTAWSSAAEDGTFGCAMTMQYVPNTRCRTEIPGGALPEVSSILRADANPTSASLVDFRVAFTEAVSGVDATDFVLATTGVTGTTVTAVQDGPVTYTVTVDTGSGDGDIRLDLIDDDSIIDGTSVPLGGSGAGNGDFTAGETYGIDKTPPTFQSVVADPPYARVGLPVTITFTVSEPLRANPDVSVNGHAAYYVSHAGTDYTYAYVILVSDFEGDASILVSGTDLAGNPGGAGSATALDVDNTPPVSSVGALQLYETTAIFDVPWRGSDIHSGLAGVKLLYRRGATGPFLQYGDVYAFSSIPFDTAQTGGDGYYEFYTLAIDFATNEEAPPPVPDAATTVVTTVPAAPIVASEPAFNPGTVNTIWFAPPAGATACYMEWSTGPLFSAIAGDSGWLPVPQSNYTARNLADGQTYYYRVIARNVARVEGPWSTPVSSTQDASPPDSHVVSPNAEARGSTFAITSVSTDTASGVKEVRLLYRHERMADFAQWPEAFTSNTLVFDARAAQGDGVYQFYSIAEDAVGNVEAAPPSPDAQTIVVTVTRIRQWMMYR